MDDVPHVHQFPQQHGCRRRGHSGRMVECIGGGDVVGGRAHPADACRHVRHAVGLHADQDLLKAAKLIDHQAGIFEPAVVVEVDEHLGVPFDAGHRINFDAFLHAVPPAS